MTPLRRARTYRHPHCIDVDMHVVAIRNITDEYFKLEVAWVNRWNGMVIEDQKPVYLLRRDWGVWWGVKGGEIG